MDDPKLEDINLDEVSYTEDDLMPFGVHEGKKLKHLPAGYLIWCFENMAKLDIRLQRYISDNLDELYGQKIEEDEQNENNW